MNNRNGERGAIPSRSERLFSKNGYWYFSTREGLDIGPFDSQDAAAYGVEQFIGYIGQIEPNILKRVTKYVKAA